MTHHITLVHPEEGEPAGHLYCEGELHMPVKGIAILDVNAQSDNDPQIHKCFP